MLYNDNVQLNFGLPEYVEYFKQDSILTTYQIPSDKPSVESICDIFINPRVLNYKLIQTECGLSNEGQKLTGNKLCVDVRIQIKITYCSDDCNQTIYAVDYEVLKSICIVLPNEIGDKNLYSLYNSSRLTITPYVEHSYTRILCADELLTSILLLLDVKFF